MNKFDLDYTKLEDKLTAKKAYKLSDVKDKIKKVAFDVVRFTDKQDIDGLWQIQNCEDGDYIVAMYDENENKDVVKESSKWTVVTDRGNKFANILYKDLPIAKISLASYGMTGEDARNYLPDSLESNKKLASSLLNTLEPEVLQEVLSKFPELKNTEDK
jgi:hypothetical protein